MKTFHSGFTLIELMVAITLLAVVMVVAVPFMRSTIQNNRVVASTNDLVTVLNLARSEAIKRGVSVSVCPSTDSNHTACGNNWNNDWLVFVNPDENSTFANNATEPLLRVEQINASMSVSTSPATSVATYTSQGFANGSTANLSFSLSASDCTGNYARTVSISAVGRISVAEAACP